MVFEKLRALLSEQLDIDAETITMDTHIVDDLGADSLDVVELIMALEAEFDLVITDEAPENFLQPERVVSVPACSYNFLSAIFEGIPSCVLFDYIQRIKGNGYYASDMIDSWFPFGGAILRTSDIVDVD